MKLLLFYSFCVLCPLIISCHSPQKITGKSVHFPLSPLTATFIDKLKRENPAKPSATFINEFNLLNTGGMYYVSGMAMVDSAFNEKAIEQLKVHINTRAGNIFTLQIPIINFNRLLQTTGIDYLEVSGRANLKNQ